MEGKDGELSHTTVYPLQNPSTLGVPMVLVVASQHVAWR